MSNFSLPDQTFMLEALQLALQAKYVSDPNPRVGCVLVKNDHIIGRGFTQEPGNHHAEIMALLDAQKNGADMSGATAYVTLEPCCHVGKTPPCTKALIQAKLQRVVIATMDPNPLVAGQGAAELMASGMVVQSGLFELQAMMQNLGFMKRMKDGLPWVRLKIAASLDGVTALQNGQSQWITGPIARADGHQWRAQASVLLTGGGTVLADNPQLNVRDVAVFQQPLRAIIDSKLETPLDAQILHNGRTIIFCADLDQLHDASKLSPLHDLGVQVISLPNAQGKVDLPKVFSYLAKEHSANEVHVEAGAKLNGSLLREQCVDELLMYLAPSLLGMGAGLTNLGPYTSLDERQSWKFIDQQMVGADLRLRLVREI
jgi:diaminohydroxyphosphoribosylaminopyrimidine deaminase / 5-amino-6-(5-phosphoribosylamino)uracil reductase